LWFCGGTVAGASPVAPTSSLRSRRVRIIVFIALVFRHFSVLRRLKLRFRRAASQQGKAAAQAQQWAAAAASNRLAQNLRAANPEAEAAIQRVGERLGAAGTGAPPQPQATRLQTATPLLFDATQTAAAAGSVPLASQTDLRPAITLLRGIRCRLRQSCELQPVVDAAFQPLY
jgi:hypothetical protein